MSSTSPHIALVDCNNFFVSCERIFRPDLANRPVIVLSSNDGCVISRSDESKILGFSMGEPYFQVKERCRQHGVAVFSSNFPLYQDISRRVMHVLRRFSDVVEVYSIDEAFFVLPGRGGPISGGSTDRDRVCEVEWLREQAARIRHTILGEVGIPVSVGVAPTKTLAKVASYIAKETQRRQSVVDDTIHTAASPRHVRDPVFFDGASVCEGVAVLTDPVAYAWARRVTPIDKVWGIGMRVAPRLRAAGILTADDLVTQPDHWVRRHLSVRGTRTVEELSGVRCYPVDTCSVLRKSLVHSRSFGRTVYTLQELSGVVAYHARKVAEILRAERAVAREVHVMVRTSRHRAVLRHDAKGSDILVAHTDDTLTLVHAACTILTRIYRSGYPYAKAGVMVCDIVRAEAQPRSTLFGEDTTVRASLTGTLDAIRSKYGDVVRVGVEGVRHGSETRQAYMSPQYTTAWSCVRRIANNASTSISTSPSHADTDAPFHARG